MWVYLGCGARLLQSSHIPGRRHRNRPAMATTCSGRADCRLAPRHGFDLASLTKVLFTTPTILHLVAQGRIGLPANLICGY